MSFDWRSKVASVRASTPAPEPVVAEQTSVPNTQEPVGINPPTGVPSTTEPAGINPPTGVPLGEPVLLGEFDADRGKKGPFYQTDAGEWLTIKGLRKPELWDVVNLLTTRVRARALGETYLRHIGASMLDFKQIGAQAKTSVDGLKQTATLLIQVLAGSDERLLRLSGVDELPETVPEYRTEAVRIERGTEARTVELVALLRAGRGHDFVRMVNASFEAPLSADLLERTLATVPEQGQETVEVTPVPESATLPDLPDDDDGELSDVAAKVLDDDLLSFTPTDVAAWNLKYMQQAAEECPHDEPLHNDKDGCPACDGLGEEPVPMTKDEPERRHDSRTRVYVGCEVIGGDKPGQSQYDFDLFLLQAENAIAEKTGAAYGQANYSEDYKLMSALVAKYADTNPNMGALHLASFRRDRQYILDAMVRGGWIVVVGR